MRVSGRFCPSPPVLFPIPPYCVAAALFAATGIGVGRAFHDTIEPLVRGLDAYARPIGLALALAIGAWLAYVVLVKRRRRVL